MEFDLVGFVVLAAAMVSLIVIVAVYLGYKFFHEPAVIDWMARHGIVEIDDEIEER